MCNTTNPRLATSFESRQWARPGPTARRGCPAPPRRAPAAPGPRRRCPGRRSGRVAGYFWYTYYNGCANGWCYTMPVNKSNTKIPRSRHWQGISGGPGKRLRGAVGACRAAVRDRWGLRIRTRNDIREMGGAPRNPAPRNHLLVWIVKPSGCHCTDGQLTSRALTEDQQMS